MSTAAGQGSRETSRSLAGKTLFITGASRGIGEAIGIRAARDGAQVAIFAKTVEPHPKLPGTIHTAAKAMEKAGGQALPLAGDVRDESQVRAALEETVATFGGIDIVVNNASAIFLAPTPEISLKRYDLLQSVNVRATFLVSKLAHPHLKRAANPHILTLAPPLNLDPKWFAPHLAYTLSKYGMSLCVLGMSREFRPAGIAVNALWPRTVIATAALAMLPGVDSNRCRRPEITAHAAHAILVRDATSCSGNFFIDEQVLADEGEKDFERYAMKAGEPLLEDLFLEGSSEGVS